MKPFLVFAILFAALCSAPTASADLLELTDGNFIECKFVEQIKGARGKDILVVEMEDGKREKYPMTRVKSFIRMKKTSWELQAEREKWYAKEAPKVKETWSAQARFARKCLGKRLEDQARTHYTNAYELRKPLVKEDDQKALLKFADWLEDNELFEEAQIERRRVFELRKAKLPDNDAKAHEKLAKWCQSKELLAEAVQQYEAAIAIKTHRTYVKQVEKLRNQLTIPMDPGFYRGTRVRVAAAAKYLKKQQDSDGGIGSDINEAGVHGKRAMTAIGTMALLADWDFGVLSGKYEAEEIPDEVLEALDYIIGFTPTNGRLLGDDVWGPIFALDLLVNCWNRPQFRGEEGPTQVEGSDLRKRIGDEINRLIAELKRLQRSDGGWMYYNFTNKSASFVSAAGIVSLVGASNAGFEVEKSMITRAVEQVKSMRQGHGTFTYSAGLTQGPVGACARSPLCELALTLTGDTKPSSLRYAVNIFFNNRHILERLKGMSGTHIGEGKTAPYYLLFAHYWTARAIKHLELNLQRKYLKGLGTGLIAYQEKDGTFGDWTGTADYQVYGTALAALTMYYVASLNAGVERLKDAPPVEDDEDEDADPGKDSEGKSDEKKAGSEAGV